MRKRLPPLNALRSFEAAARNGSFRDAADELCVSHSAISHQVKLLENFLEIELFTRKARAVELTEAGREYHPQLKEAFDLISLATSKLTAPNPQNIITIKLYNTFAIRWLLPRLPRFNKRHPELQVRINTSQEEVDLLNDDCDGCIMLGTNKQNQLRHEFLFSTELFPVCSPEFLSKNELISPSDLKASHIIQVSPSASDWKVWLEAHGLNTIDPNSGMVFDSYDHSLATAIQGLGIALGMQPYIANELADGSLIELFPELRIQHPKSWYFVSKDSDKLSAKLQAFVNWLKQEIAADDSLTLIAKQKLAERELAEA